MRSHQFWLRSRTERSQRSTARKRGFFVPRKRLEIQPHPQWRVTHRVQRRQSLHARGSLLPTFLDANRKCDTQPAHKERVKSPGIRATNGELFSFNNFRRANGYPLW